MLPTLPSYIVIVFLFALVLSVQLFLRATKNKSWPSLVILAWALITGLLAYQGFFLETTGPVPRLAIAIVPAIIFIIILLISKRFQGFINSLDLKNLTLLHIVRIPVELVLYWLSVQKLVPELMTFTGRNFDIIAGLTAPLIYFACFNGNQLVNRKLLLAWNILGLLLLLNIVVNAALSAPSRIQQFAFDQPNVAVLYFPYIFLPSIIVMLVLFSHLVAIKRLIRAN